MRPILLGLALLAASALSVRAHELWIEPLEHRVAADGMLRAHLVNGQLFEGNRLSYIPGRFERFEVIGPGGTRPVENRIGARPALEMPAGDEGLAVAVYRSAVSVVTYDDFDAFLRFADHKDFAGAEARHRDAGHPTDTFKEAYSRYSKALIAVGHGMGADLRTGLETEIVALDNPYTDDVAEGMRVQVFYGDGVRPDAQVELFEKAPGGAVEITYHRTDARGIAMLPVRPGHAYMADAVVLRAPSAALAAERGVAWETLWAELNFAVPGE